jgi:hypothetical protein
MKKIANLSDLVAAAGADQQTVTEFIESQGFCQDRHSKFEIHQDPEIFDYYLEKTKDELLDEYEEEEEVGEYLEGVQELKKVVDYMKSNGIDLFHDDLIWYVD